MAGASPRFSDLSKLQAEALEAAAQAASPDDRERSVNLLKVMAEAEKNLLEAERAKPQLRSEGVRFWAPIVASFISAIALVVTLGIQIHNSSLQREANDKNETLQREANEETEWREMLVTARSLTAGSGSAPSEPAGQISRQANAVSGSAPLVPLPQLVLIQIKSFLDAPSAKHKPEARTLALNLLGAAADGRIDPLIFEQLLYSLGVDGGTLNQILQIDRDLARAYYEASNRVVEIDKQTKDQAAPNIPPSKGLPGTERPAPAGESVLLMERTAKEAVRDRADREVKVISDAVAVYLKKANGGAESPDLSYARFWSSDWSGIKFRKANLTGTYFDQVQLDEADLSEVSRYTEAVFDRSAWWRAKAISPAFLAAIKKDPRHEYSVDKPYPTESPAIRPDDYARELKRLSAESRGPGLQVARPTGHR